MREFGQRGQFSSDRRAKFFDCCRGLDQAVATTLYDRLQSLDEESDVGFLDAAFAATVWNDGATRPNIMLTLSLHP